VAPLRAGPSYGLPGQAPKRREWVKIQSAISSKAGQDSTGVDRLRYGRSRSGVFFSQDFPEQAVDFIV
ncbi:MAG: hypothetical protein QOH31_4633, partial [Verrucomicrobiota bacterium]